MTLGSILAPVFAVLFVLSGESRFEKSPTSLNKVSGPKVSPLEPYLSESLVCTLFESHTLIRKEKVVARMESTTAQCGHKNIAARGQFPSRYPIDTLDPPIVIAKS
jgi:hypothetical protein